jgi:hypothetical protein
MKFQEIEKHKIIKLIEFSLEHTTFSVRQAMDASGMSKDEFSGAKYVIFQLKGVHEYPSEDQELDWPLSTEALFNYLSFLEYRDALKFSRRTFWVAIASVLLVTVSLVINILLLLAKN